MAEHAIKCPKLPWMIDFFSTDQGQTPKQQLQAVFNENRIDYLSKLNYKSVPGRKRLTSVMCTLGPKSTDPRDIECLLALGMNVARLKMAYFTPTECDTILTNIRTAVESFSKRIGTMYPLGICLDLRGPEIRTGTLKDPHVARLNFNAGEHTYITSDPSYEELVTKDMIYVDYQSINEIIEPGDKLRINNSVALSALEIVGSVIKCLIERAGTICDRASVQLESSLLELPSVSNMELKYAMEQNVDMVIVANVRDKATLKGIRSELGAKGQHIAIVAKIQSLIGVQNLDEILEEADAIYFSRSDLQQATRPEKLFVMQKQILACCNKAGKPVIVAPELLESMANTDAPTKAEILDVTNCILDGADCLLLSRETAIGNFAVEAVTTLNALCLEAESAIHQRQVFLDLSRENVWPHEPIYALAMSVVEASMKSNAACIIMLTTSGRSAQVVARYRPRCPIIALTRYGSVARKLQLYRAVDPIHFVRKPTPDWSKDVQARVQFGITYAKYLHMIRAGDTILVVSGSRAGTGFTNSMSIYYASDFDVMDCNDSQISER